jgi:hypothetical protein
MRRTLVRCVRADDLAGVWAAGFIWVAAGASSVQGDAGGGEGLEPETEEGARGEGRRWREADRLSADASDDSPFGNPAESDATRERP